MNKFKEPIFNLKNYPNTLLLDASTVLHFASQTEFNSLTEQLYSLDKGEGFFEMAIRKKIGNYYMEKCDKGNLDYLGYLLSFLEQWVLADEVIVHKQALDSLKIRGSSNLNSAINELSQKMFQVVDIFPTRLTDAASAVLNIQTKLDDLSGNYFDLGFSNPDIDLKDKYYSKFNWKLGESNNSFPRTLFYFELARLLGTSLFLNPEKTEFLRNFCSSINNSISFHYKKLNQEILKKTDINEIDIPIPPIADEILNVAKIERCSLLQSATIVRQSSKIKSLKDLLKEFDVLKSVENCRTVLPKIESVAQEISKSINGRIGENRYISKRKLNLGALPTVGWILRLIGAETISVNDISFSEAEHVVFYHSWIRPKLGN